MNTLAVAPVQWSNLRNIDDVQPVNDGDTDCLVEIREVLRRHGKLDRFGVALLHSHFDLANDEILLESSDEESRTLVTKPVKEAETAGTRKVGTIWMLREGDIAAMSWCRSYCQQNIVGHSKKHKVVKD